MWNLICRGLRSEAGTGVGRKMLKMCVAQMALKGQNGAVLWGQRLGFIVQMGDNVAQMARIQGAKSRGFRILLQIIGYNPCFAF